MGLTTEELHQMQQRAQNMLDKAYAPYSRFLVGVCIKSGNAYYCGCNIENVSYSLTLCAEATAVGNMISSGHKKIDAVVLVSSGDKMCPPCGACRQILAEFSNPEAKVYMFDRQQNCHTSTLRELLPLSFNQSNLNH